MNFQFKSSVERRHHPLCRLHDVAPGSGKFILNAVLGLGLLLASGCAAARLKGDFRGYESAYAESANRQMLLNLARLEQHHPTFFLKLGQISTSYRMQANMGNAISQSEKPLSGAWTGTPSLGFEKSPQFTFIPVNDDTLAERLLKPVSADIFYALYQQGWRVDQLFRLMVDRIEMRKSGTEAVEVFRNVPSADNRPGFATFLRVTAIAHELQQHGLLMLDGQKKFVPLAKGWQRKDPPEAKDLWEAKAKNAIWMRTAEGAWELGTERLQPVFRLNLSAGNDEKRAKELASYEKIIAQAAPELDQSESLLNTMKILENGFAIQESAEGNKYERGFGPESCHLVMRSLISLMAAAGQEQAAFDELLQDPTFRDLIPIKERQPLLRLTWPGPETQLTPSLVRLDYANKTYLVADEKTGHALDARSWNRDVFRLISQLASQVTVDISKFPLPEILQLRSN
jgi:hypothetical protein